MIVLKDVFWKIREMSEREVNPRPVIMINDLSRELSILNSQVMPVLNELKRMRIISFGRPLGETIKLTMLGTSISPDELPAEV